MELTKSKNLFGLVLAGGRSLRMNQDKALIQYFDKPQFAHHYELLKQHCDQTFISLRDDQKNHLEFTGYPIVLDQQSFLNIGPIGGILSAMQLYPQSSWLVLACDLPFVTNATIAELIKKRNVKKLATAYQSHYDQLPEPLCAIYEPAAFKAMNIFLQADKSCPRKFLINHDVELIQQMDKMSLDNVNSPNEYQEALKVIKSNHSYGQ